MRERIKRTSRTPQSPTGSTFSRARDWTEATIGYSIDSRTNPGDIGSEKGEYCLKKVFPSRVSYYFNSRELEELEMKGIEKKVGRNSRRPRIIRTTSRKGIR
jgi:hypothetical protein